MAKENYKINKIEKLPDSEAEIIGELSLDYLNTCRTEAIKHFKERLDLSGFRKGHIPEDVVIKTVGEMGILEESAEIALAKEYGPIILESKLRPMLRPEIAVTKLAPGIPLEFKIRLILEPEFELPEYKKIALDVIKAPIEKVEGAKELTEEEKKEKLRVSILEKIEESTKLELPQRFLEAESQHMLHHLKQDVLKAGLKWEEYLEKIEKKEEDLKDGWKKHIASRAKLELIVAKIAEKENLKTYGEVFELLEKA